MSDLNMLLLVRHAESFHHVNGLTGGWTDRGLTEIGREQARVLASRLGSELRGVPVSLYASDLKRAAETAEGVAAALSVDVLSEPSLREWNNGEAAGLTVVEASQRFPPYDPARLLDVRAYPGAETVREFHERVAVFLTGLSSRDALPILVTHGGTMRRAIFWWLGVSVEASWNSFDFENYPTGLTFLAEGTWGGPMIERLNDIAHLSGHESAASYSLGSLLQALQGIIPRL